MNVVDADWIVKHYSIDEEDVLIAAQNCAATSLHYEDLRQVLFEYLIRKGGRKCCYGC